MLIAGNRGMAHSPEEGFPIEDYTRLVRPRQATANMPGIAAIRIWTQFEAHGPQAPVRIRTEPDPGELRMLVDDIAALRQEVDVAFLTSKQAGLITGAPPFWPKAAWSIHFL